MERFKHQMAAMFGVRNVGRVVIRQSDAGEIVFEMHLGPKDLLGIVEAMTAEVGPEVDEETIAAAVEEAKVDVFRQTYGETPAAPTGAA